MTISGIQACDKLGLKQVINLTAPLAILKKIILIPDPKEQFLCCGMLCQIQGMRQLAEKN